MRIKLTIQHVCTRIKMAILFNHVDCCCTRMSYIDDAVSPSQNRSKPPLTERNRCVRYLCCACCLPVWARWIVWFIIIAIIILIIIFAALFATFTMPSFDFAGVSNSTSDTQPSRLSFDGHVAKINFDLLIHAQNPNVLGIDLSQINATASIIIIIIMFDAY